MNEWVGDVHLHKPSRNIQSIFLSTELLHDVDDVIKWTISPGWPQLQQEEQRSIKEADA